MFRYKNAKGFTEETRMNIGDSVYIPNCQPHQLESLEDNSEILEISTYHNDLDVIRIEPGDSQK
jgi:mannose-6-phosphate isomerase-like protein (cupin superfamily)